MVGRDICLVGPGIPDFLIIQLKTREIMSKEYNVGDLASFMVSKQMSRKNDNPYEERIYSISSLAWFLSRNNLWGDAQNLIELLGIDQLKILRKIFVDTFNETKKEYPYIGREGYIYWLKKEKKLMRGVELYGETPTEIKLGSKDE